eukprot:3664254-Rhodomonas_salina.1
MTCTTRMSIPATAEQERRRRAAATCKRCAMQSAVPILVLPAHLPYHHPLGQYRTRVSTLEADSAHLCPGT